MQITKRSILTGQTNTLELDISAAQYARFNSPDRPLIQDMFPDLTVGEREFLMTGITPQEWDTVFGSDKEEGFGPEVY
jgi:hypothetical protein